LALVAGIDGEHDCLAHLAHLGLAYQQGRYKASADVFEYRSPRARIFSLDGLPDIGSLPLSRAHPAAR